ncbi:MAG: alanine racemase [Desulfobacteraceae bacterium]|nr:MAG: alanine racemase [Desulfobacteraceae bacterium]
MLESPNRVRIDLNALLKNLEVVKRFLHPGTKIMGIVKSDAYGHGLVPVSRALEANGIYSLGVAHPGEGVELRRNGIRSPIVVLCGIRSRDEAAEVLAWGLTPVVFDLEAAEMLSAECVRRGKKVDVHLKVDTGMSRLGIPCDKISPFLERVARFSMLEVRGLASHLSSADEQDPEFTEAQIDRFRDAVDRGRSIGFRLDLNNLANSAGVIRYEKSHFDMVRPGIILYGGLPSPNFSDPPPLAPVMFFRGRVLQVKDLPDNTPVGYGRTYHTTGAKKVAVLSAGYGDGLPRSVSNRGAVLIRSRRCALLGTVCMNMAVCDVSGLPDVKVGDEAVFLGTAEGEAITGDDLARWGNTISYEIFCSVGQRHIREYS